MTSLTSSIIRNNPSFFQDREIDLLRNMSIGRGIGFFGAGNFHPDFILWLLTGTTSTTSPLSIHTDSRQRHFGSIESNASDH